MYIYPYLFSCLLFSSSPITNYKLFFNTIVIHFNSYLFIIIKAKVLMNSDLKILLNFSTMKMTRAHVLAECLLGHIQIGMGRA